MDLSTGKWFNYLAEEVRLTEGVRDIGLPEVIIDHLESSLSVAPEKAKTWMGHQWKKTNLSQVSGTPQRLVFKVVSDLIDEYGGSEPVLGVWEFINYVVDAMERRYRYMHLESDNVDEMRKLIESDWDAFAQNIASNKILYTGEEALRQNGGRPEWALQPAATRMPSYFYAATPEKFAQFLMGNVPQGDEEEAKWTKTKFIIQNLKNTIKDLPFGKWGKAFKKALRALSKEGYDSEQVEKTQELLRETLRISYERFERSFMAVFALLNEDPTNFEIIKGADDINTALKEAQRHFDNQEDPENIIHTFDDGSYWYDLKVDNCPVEAERMGHCGADSRGTLISLRKKDQKRKASKSYVTMSYDPHTNTLYQIKGRANDVPPNEMWEHIDWFIKNMEVDNLEETGEHSRNPQDFQEMIGYLEQENPGLNVSGGAQAMLEQAEVEATEMENNYQEELENLQIQFGEPELLEDYETSIELRVDAQIEFQVPLGWDNWKRIDEREPFVYAVVNGEVDKSLKPIPYIGAMSTFPETFRTFHSAHREFIENTDLMEVAEEVFGGASDYDVDYNIGLLEGPAPAGSNEGKEQVYLIITLMGGETRTIWNQGDDSIYLDEIAEFVDSAAMEVEGDKEFEIAEKIRTQIAAAGYGKRNAWDKDHDSIEKMVDELTHFQTYISAAEAAFWFREKRDGGTQFLTDIVMPAEVYVYLNKGLALHQGQPRFLTLGLGDPQQFGRSNRHNIFYANDDIQARMIRELQKGFQAATPPEAGETQEPLPFGDKYKAGPPPALVLAKNMSFKIVPQLSNPFQNRNPTIKFAWRFTIEIKSKDNIEEIDTAKGLVEYFDKNPEIVINAANNVIRESVDQFVSLAQEAKENTLSDPLNMRLIRGLEDTYAAGALTGNDVAEKVMIIVKWIYQNWSDMNDVEKYVSHYTFLMPMTQRRFHAYGGEGQSDDTGKPVVFDTRVENELLKRGAAPAHLRGRGAAPIQESMEEQINRVARLLQEKDPAYDLRTYKVRMDVSIQKDIGGDIQQTQTEIRGIDGVTTVSSVGVTTRRLQKDFGTIEIKFELLGATSRDKYLKRVLAPQLYRIKGLTILRAGQAEQIAEKKSHTLKEYFPPVDVLDAHSPPLVTPALSLDQIVADWVDASVMAYDHPLDIRDMRYHVMMPVVELLPFISREFRAPKDAFDGMYRNFINTGPRAPVFIAIGKDGRVKVTGNEDLIWFAKRSGLEELPVFFSYQTQV